eukprot:NODE_13199_length_1179_cov_6.070342.p1 GENE.NODE_13199_length_1179_cov_6.070342~~NODE_13199_length_1179_cov_6.070342.p1  ORF type:complete len:272 (-),score=42.27 NODE_13199_length_1179_cov_6.070342:286-1101(-)
MLALCGRYLCGCFNPKACGTPVVDILVNFLGIATACAVIAAGFYEGLSVSTTFTWHVICMAIAVPFLLVAGRWAYQMDRQSLDFHEATVEDGLAAAQGHPNKEEVYGVKWTRRNLHGNFMLLGALTMCLGYTFIAISHWSKQEYFGYDFATGAWESPTRVAHAWVGYLMILLVLQQVGVGLAKYAALTDGLSICRCHGSLGRFVVGLGCVNIILGMIADSFSTALVCLVGFLALLMGYFGAVHPLCRSGPELEAACPAGYGAARGDANRRV